jgi:biopolymer transport protein ExbB
MDMFRFAIQHDWPVLLPIFVCSILAVSVAFDRWFFYVRNRRGVNAFLTGLQNEVMRGPAAAARWAEDQPGMVPRVAAEGLRALAERPEKFDSLYEVAASLASRELHRNLSMMGTIATVSPYLGLFGTVVRILITFGELASGEGGGNSASIMAGIGSALIATAFGLAVAIFAVATNNYLYAKAGEIVKDFEIVKLIALSSTTSQPLPSQRPTAPTVPLARQHAPAAPQRAWAEEERQI